MNRRNQPAMCGQDRWDHVAGGGSFAFCIPSWIDAEVPLDLLLSKCFYHIRIKYINYVSFKRKQL